MIALCKWDDLPDWMKNDAVRRYYDILDKKRISLFFNRILDVAVATIILVILSPVFLIVSIVIKAVSPGTVFFRQERITQYGRPFTIYKFRTMVENVDEIGPMIAENNDARVTKVGRFLRKNRLDEIPQLFNLIKGDMTFVGTRPEVRKFVEKYSDEMMATLLLRAGVTSKTSIQYKDEEKILQCSSDTEKAYLEYVLPEKMKLNLQSLKEYSISNEIGVLVRTVIRSKNSKHLKNDTLAIRG